MGIKLYFFVLLYLYMVTMSAQVISCQIYQHDMLCVLLGIGDQAFGQDLILQVITAAFEGSGNGIYMCLPVLDADLGLW